MADRDHKQTDTGWRGMEKEDDALDRELDAALAKYAAVEPRAGLENRILANLQAERSRIPGRAWWHWSVPAALAAAVGVAVVVLAWRSLKPAQVVVGDHPPTTQGSAQSGTKVAANSGNGVRPQVPPMARKTAGHRVRPVAAMAALPKLEQFPSPQPLSAQEQILAAYVVEHHQQAVLAARARMEALKQDLAEETAEASANSNGTISESPASQQTNR
jgi:hypothetical protein